MFEELSNKLQEISNKVSNKGFLNAENIVSALQEVKIALLEADVNFRVVNSFLKKVKEKASGTEVIGNLSAGQQFIKVIHRELTLLLGETNQQIDLNQTGICNIMLVGLQGSGKTTSAAKLALYLKKKGKKVLLVPADIYRPAAIDQLKVLAASIEVDCYNSSPKTPTRDSESRTSASKKREIWRYDCRYSGKTTSGRKTRDFELIYSGWSVDIRWHKQNFFPFFFEIKS